MLRIFLMDALTDTEAASTVLGSHLLIYDRVGQNPVGQSRRTKTQGKENVQNASDELQGQAQWECDCPILFAPDKDGFLHFGVDFHKPDAPHLQMLPPRYLVWPSA